MYKFYERDLFYTTFTTKCISENTGEKKVFVKCYYVLSNNTGLDQTEFGYIFSEKGSAALLLSVFQIQHYYFLCNNTTTNTTNKYLGGGKYFLAKSASLFHDVAKYILITDLVLQTHIVTKKSCFICQFSELHFYLSFANSKFCIQSSSISTITTSHSNYLVDKMFVIKIFMNERGKNQCKRHFWGNHF